MNRITIKGKINDQGGLAVAQSLEFKQFKEQSKGKDIIIQIESVDKESSELLVGYYFGKIVHAYQVAHFENAGEWMTLKDVDMMLRRSFPPMRIDLPKEETNGFDLVTVKNPYKVGNKVLSDFVDFCRAKCAQDFGVIISDPNSNHKQKSL